MVPIIPQITCCCVPRIDQVPRMLCIVMTISHYYKFPFIQKHPSRCVLRKRCSPVNLLHISIMMMMMNCFCGMADRRIAFRLISSPDYCEQGLSHCSDNHYSTAPHQKIFYKNTYGRLPLFHNKMKYSFHKS